MIEFKISIANTILKYSVKNVSALSTRIHGALWLIYMK